MQKGAHRSERLCKYAIDRIAHRKLSLETTAFIREMKKAADAMARAGLQLAPQFLTRA